MWWPHHRSLQKWEKYFVCVRTISAQCWLAEWWWFQTTWPPPSPVVLEENLNRLFFKRERAVVSFPLPLFPLTFLALSLQAAIGDSCALWPNSFPLSNETTFENKAQQEKVSKAKCYFHGGFSKTTASLIAAPLTTRHKYLILTIAKAQTIVMQSSPLSCLPCFLI